MKLSDLGEAHLIAMLAEELQQSLPTRHLGIGDDAAVIPISSTHSQVVTTDLLIENVHFLKDTISPKDLGYKALAVNLSDIAAMGAKPQYAFVSLALPSTTSVEWVKDLYQGISELAQKYQVWVLGGDTTDSKSDIMINITLIGTLKNSHCKLRSHARVGDVICVTSYLGDSAAGLKWILEQRQNLNMTPTYDPDQSAQQSADQIVDQRTQQSADRIVDQGSHQNAGQSAHLVRQHLRPSPFVVEGQWLAEQQSVHAMMDLSDGLHLDLPKILHASNCGAEIELSEVPLSPSLSVIAEKYSWDPFDLALVGGEDYCLLLTVAPQDFSAVARLYQKKFNTPLHPIGKILPAPTSLHYTYHHQSYSVSPKGFEHFK